MPSVHSSLTSDIIDPTSDCGNTLATGATSVSLLDCNMPCSGNASEYCGADNLLNLYWSDAKSDTTPSSIGQWDSLGCYMSVLDIAFSHCF